MSCASIFRQSANYIRFYCQLEQYFHKSWKLADIEEVH